LDLTDIKAAGRLSTDGEVVAVHKGGVEEIWALMEWMRGSKWERRLVSMET